MAYVIMALSKRISLSLYGLYVKMSLHSIKS